MNVFTVPWLELSVLLPAVGAVWVALARAPDVAARRCLVVTGGVLGCTLMAFAGYDTGLGRAGSPWDLAHLTGRPGLAVDEVSAPLLPLVALLHFLTTLATARTKMVRFSFTWALLGEAVRLAAFAAADDGALVGLLAVGTLPPFFEMRRRGRPPRVYAAHMGLFVALLGGGWAVVTLGLQDLGAVLMLAALLVRSGVVPAHIWVTDLFENCSFGAALLFATPLAGVYGTVRLVLPIAPDWALQALGVISLVTAVYAAGMAVVQQEARRFFAFLFLSHASLVLVGLELHTAISLTGALALWFSVALSLSGLGLTLRALEARLGRLPLTGFRGLYDQSPSLAVCFMMTGLASVGFPGTLGYVAAELVVDGAVGVSPVVGLAVIVAGAINGIAIVRAYFLLFTGTRHSTGVSLSITGRERFAVLTLAALIVGGGLIPQFHTESRHRAAVALLADRDTRTGTPPEEHSH